MTNQPIELGSADILLAEGRLRAKRDQIPFMEALKKVVAEKLREKLQGGKNGSPRDQER
jgi:hypothetical protein